MLPVPRTLATSLTLSVNASSGDADLEAELRYDPSDPLAVALVIGADCAEPVIWFFARDLLASGISSPSGEGDITIEPALTGGDRLLRVTLATDCLATMTLSRDTALEFLIDTYTQVPSGCEMDRADLDAEILALLG